MDQVDRLRGILDLVENTLDEPETRAEDLAARAYLSRFHFDRLVSAALGEPPGALRRRVLLERAAHRLLRTADPIIEVALDAGYGSPEAFAGPSGGRTEWLRRPTGAGSRPTRRTTPYATTSPDPAGSTSTHRAACGCPRPRGAPAWTS